MKDIAKDADVSVNTVSRLLPPLAVSIKHLPEVLCIDEFKGNTGYYKYQVSLMDGKTRKPIDIIECRYKTHLLDYFNKFSLEERKKVKYVVTDLWKTYKDLANTYFPNAKVVADKFHFVNMQLKQLILLGSKCKKNYHEEKESILNIQENYFYQSMRI